MKVPLSDRNLCLAVFAALIISKPFVFAAVDVSYEECAEYGPNSVFIEEGKLHLNFDCSKVTEKCLYSLVPKGKGNINPSLSLIRRYCDGSVPTKTLSFQFFDPYSIRALLHADGPKSTSSKTHETIASKFVEFMGQTGANCQSLPFIKECVEDDESLKVITENCFKNIKQPFEGLNKKHMHLLPSFTWKYLSSKTPKDSNGFSSLISREFSLFLFELDPEKQSETIKFIASQIGLCDPDDVNVIDDDCDANLIMKLFVPGSTISKAIGSSKKDWGKTWTKLFNEAIPQLQKTHFDLLSPFDFFSKPIS